MTTPEEKLRDTILQQAREGQVVFMTIDGAYSAPLDEFIKQPTDGILYDLNRDKATVLTFINDPKWANDFAVALVIEKLKAENDALQSRLNDAVEALKIYADPNNWRPISVEQFTGVYRVFGGHDKNDLNGGGVAVRALEKIKVTK